jgi:hypothetical protein
LYVWDSPENKGSTFSQLIHIQKPQRYEQNIFNLVSRNGAFFPQVVTHMRLYNLVISKVNIHSTSNNSVIIRKINRYLKENPTFELKEVNTSLIVNSVLRIEQLVEVLDPSILFDNDAFGFLLSEKNLQLTDFEWNHFFIQIKDIASSLKSVYSKVELPEAFFEEFPFLNNKLI